MKQRLISALIALSIVVPLLVYGDKIGMYILAYFIVILGTDEWLRMSIPNSRQVWVPFQIIATTCLTTCLLTTHDLLALVGASIVSMVVALYGTKSNSEAQKALLSLFSVFLLGWTGTTDVDALARKWTCLAVFYVLCNLGG